MFFLLWLQFLGVREYIQSRVGLRLFSPPSFPSKGPQVREYIQSRVGLRLQVRQVSNPRHNGQRVYPVQSRIKTNEKPLGTCRQICVRVHIQSRVGLRLNVENHPVQNLTVRAYIQSRWLRAPHAKPCRPKHRFASVVGSARLSFS